LRVTACLSWGDCVIGQPTRSPIARASGEKKTVIARYVRNERLTDALRAQAFTALTASPGARALYDAERARGTEQNAALRKLANRLVGIRSGGISPGV
jgi:hypothetical protein